MKQREIQLEQGVIRYREAGAGPTLLFIHGLLVAGSLWDGVANRLSDSFHCVVPDWPLGSHSIGLRPEADLSPEGVAELVASFIQRAALKNVTLVGNDSGGAICQLVATRHPRLVSGLVLTTCDAFDVFPPSRFRYLAWVARIPGFTALLAKSMMLLPFLRRLPIAYGSLTRTRLDPALTESWVKPTAERPDVRRDVTKFLKGMNPELTLRTAEALRSFAEPALLLWSSGQELFPARLATGLAERLSGATIEWLPEAGAFSPIDEPEQVAKSIRNFAARQLTSRAAS